VFVLPPDQSVVAIADLSPEQPRARTRGAAHDAFDLVFTLPFDESSVQGYVAHDEPESAAGADGLDPASAPGASGTLGTPSTYLGADSGGASAKKVVGFGALGAGAIAAGIGATYAVLGVRESNGATPTESQRDAASRNDRITSDRTATIVGLGVGGALIATGVVVLLWPSAPKALRGASALVGPRGASLAVGATF
jgi:hypothetical protein